MAARNTLTMLTACPASRTDAPLRLVVVGGGFTGAALVIHMLRAGTRPLDIVVIEPSAELGRGVAYATEHAEHRINVPSDRMGLSPDDPCEATRWFFAQGVLPDEGSADGEGHFYVPRHAYGAYVRHMLDETIEASRGWSSFRHVRDSATAINSTGEGWTVSLAQGGSIEADIVALCFGHAVPHRPCRLTDDVAHHPKFYSDPWDAAGFASIAADDAVLIVGTGLTMADVVVGLRARGQRGPITAISRRGLLSRPHGRFVDRDFLAGVPAPTTALALLRLARRRAREAEPDPGWQPVADALRSSLPVLWAALPRREKHRMLQRLLPFWDVHRFRVAPQVHAKLEQDRAAGHLIVERGGLDGLARADGRFVATIGRPGNPRQQAHFDAVVLCTGPEKDLRKNPFAASLLAAGLARLDDTGLGLAVDSQNHMFDRNGSAHGGLLAFGPMTRGTFGEMTGAPDITKHISRVAGDLLHEAAQRRLTRA